MPKIVRADWVPKLRNRRGRAAVNIPGRELVYLNAPYGSEEASRLYRTLIAEWQATGAAQSPRGRHEERQELRFDVLIDAWWCAVVERQCGPSLQAEIRAAMAHLDGMYADLLANEFRPAHYITVRDQMVKTGLSRPVVNRYCRKIKRLLRWANLMDHIDPDVYARVAAVEDIAMGSRRDVRSPSRWCPSRTRSTGRHSRTLSRSTPMC